jgi:hypothetical protein
MMSSIRRRSLGTAIFLLVAASLAGGACGGNVTVASSSGGSTSGGGTSTGTGSTTGTVTSTSTSAGSTTGAGSGGGSGCQPACTCPPTIPTAGTPCNPCCTESCSYAMGGTCGPSAQCSPSGIWSISVPPCPPPEPCSAITTPGMCESAGGCRWLVPGCTTKMPPDGFTAGCFDVADCTVGSTCSSGQSCVTVDTNPCWNSNCEVCSGGTADICFGPG